MAGLDRGVNVGLDDNNDSVSLHGALIGKLFDDKLSFTLASHYGAENPSQLGTMLGFDAGSEKRLIVDLATTYTVDDRWRLMADLNYGHDEAPVGIGGSSATWYGGAGYVVLSATKKLDLVLRGEIFRDDDGFAVAQFAENDDLLDLQNGIFTGIDPRTVGGGRTTYYALTLGANYRPCDDLLLQAEIRYDRAGSTRPFDDSSDRDQFTFALATLFQF
jgi:putative OmpL-like beta-barrel porin-2